MASESRPPGSGDSNPAQASEPQQASPAEGQVSAEPPKETPAKSSFVNSEPVREDQVQNAVKFLSHPRVQGSPIIHRRNFLERKGLTKEEIDEAFRRVPDTSPGATSTQPTTSQADGQVGTSLNIQQQVSPQTLQPVGVAPSGIVSGFRRRFHWYHAFVAAGFLAASGAGTIIIFKNTIIPRLRSWIRKVVSDDNDDNLKKNELRPSLIEEAAAAAKAAAAAASDAAKASQELVIMKTEENKCFEKFMNLLGDQLQEIKSMKAAVWKLEGHNSERGHQAEEQYLSSSTSHLRQPVANGKTDYGTRPARSSSPAVSSEPPRPASYMEIMNMIQRGERPPNVRDINDAPPNPNQPISNPSLAPRTKPWETVQPARTSSFGPQDNSFPYQLTNDWPQRNVKITEIENEDSAFNGDTIPVTQPPQRKWVPPQPPPVAMPEAAIAIRQPKSKAPKEGTLDSTSSNGSELDELQKITKIAESGGETEVNGLILPEVNGGGVEIVSASEIQEEQVSS